MKKIITFLFSIVCFSFTISTLASEQNIIYPIYYGTKKCEINTTKETKQPPVFYDKENYNFYLEKNNLYKNEELYQSGVNYIYMEYEGNILYGIDNGKKIDLYKNKQKLLSAEYINHWSAFYNEYEKKYALEVSINQKNLILTNDTLIPVEDFEFHTRYFSENKKFFIDAYQISNSIKVVKDGNILFEKLDAYVRDVHISNDGKNTSFIWYSAKSGKETFFLNGKEIGENIYYSKFSPSGKYLYTLQTVGENEYDFYKNTEKIGSFSGKTHNYFDIVFKDDENFYFILTDWDNYALIENGKIRISYDDPIQIKAIIKKENGDIFIVKRDKTLWVDILEINEKEVLRAKKIDERYLDNGKHTFSLFPNKYTNSSEYQTFIKNQNDEYFLIVNNFIIPDFYDYFNQKNGLNNFRFASLWAGMIECQDITYLFPNIKYSREELENIIWKILKLSPEKATLLENKLNKLLSSNSLKEKEKEIFQMFLDNLKNKSLQIYAK